MSAGRLALVLAGAAALLLVPDAQVAPAAISLEKVGSSTAVDFGDGPVHVLALGSDASGSDPRRGNADAIELISLDFEHGEVSAVAIPRDTRVMLDGVGPAKLNAALPLGGTEAMVTEVQQLTGVDIQYVVTAGFADFAALVDTVGPLHVHSDVALEDDRYDLHVQPGPTTLDGRQAFGFARSRAYRDADFTRMANQQRLLEGILATLRGREDEVGFVEKGALAALQHLDTDLSPRELYRFALAIGQLNLHRTTSCVLTGPTGTTDLGSVVLLDAAYAARVAQDAADGRIDGGCSP